MLLVIDVGNTNITLAVMENGEVVGSFRLTTKTPRTSDEFGLQVLGLLGARGIVKEKIEDVIISSVVPGVMYSLQSGIIKYLGKTPLVVGAGVKTGIRIVTGNPREIGADRIVDAAAAYELYGGPVFVIDYGTATTYDLILEDGSFAAGITSPGIGICANALWNETAKLPEIEIKKPASILAKETVSSMQAGLVYGYIGQTEYIIRQVKKEAGMPDLKVVATGGLGKIIADETDLIDIYDPMLTMKGLWSIYMKNKKQ
ncbi:MAG: type III pantothenate kinase [Lachnospiraceae bacterium]|nr:type III pantothenate kinase [Lachnospiraceae bacterium]